MKADENEQERGRFSGGRGGIPQTAFKSINHEKRRWVVGSPITQQLPSFLPSLELCIDDVVQKSRDATGMESAKDTGSRILKILCPQCAVPLPRLLHADA